MKPSFQNNGNNALAKTRIIIAIISINNLPYS